MNHQSEIKEEANEIIPNEQGIPGASKEAQKVRVAHRKWNAQNVKAKKSPAFSYWQNASACASL